MVLKAIGSFLGSILSCFSSRWLSIIIFLGGEEGEGGVRGGTNYSAYSYVGQK